MAITPRFRVLGPFTVEANGRSVYLGGAKPRALLAALLVRAGEQVSCDQLVDILWPRQPPRSATANLHTYVCGLRAALAEAGDPVAPRIHSNRQRPTSYAVETHPGELDLEVFHRLLGDAGRAVDSGRRTEAYRLLEAAEALWRGPLLADLTQHRFWEAAATRASEQRLDAAERRVAMVLAGGFSEPGEPGEFGEPGGVVAELRGLLAECPIRETLWWLLISALLGAGRRAEALRAYAEAERVLADELGVAPGPDLRQLRDEVLGAPRRRERVYDVAG